jgi:outer membrane protein, adhesin transport system
MDNSKTSISKVMKQTTNKNLKTLALAVLLLCLGSPQTVEAKSVTVSEAVTNALNTNPEVRARFHAFRDVYEEQHVAYGGYLPKVDATAGIGRHWLDMESSGDKVYWRKGMRLELSQMLYDGFYTKNQVCRLKHSGQARYFEFMESMENVALESFRAYVDVLRYREMVNLAKKNYEYHQEIYKLISSRVRAGVSAGVDMEQITARLSLAQSNYLTELSNQHDVSARYHRYVGELPDETLAPVVLPDKGMPTSKIGALKEAYEHNFGLLATFSDIKAAKYAVKVQKSKFYPRLDFKAHHERTWNLDGVDGRRDESVAELALTYNIVNGGSDEAAVHQYQEKMYRAVDLKDKSAVDLRQTIAIAYNEKEVITEQVKFFDRHYKSMEQVREAYHEQFSIGKRTLLDLLDTENEYYQSRRAFYNGFFDLTIANARVYAAIGKLMTTMGVVRGEMPSMTDINIAEPRPTEKELPALEEPTRERLGVQ